MIERRWPVILGLLGGPGALAPSAVVGQMDPLLAVGFTDRALAAGAGGATPGDLLLNLEAADRRQERLSSSDRFGNVVFMSALLSSVGAVTGGLVAAGLDDHGDELGSVLQGALVGGWIGGGAGGAAASGRTVRAFVGSALGALPAIAVLDMETPAAPLLAPLTHGVIIALVTSLGRVERRGPAP